MAQPSWFNLLLLLGQVSFLAFTGVNAQSSACTGGMDLAFLVDASGSICDDKQVSTCSNWIRCLELIHNLVNFMTIGPDNVRVALIEFESSAWIIWNLTTYSDKSSLLNAIDNLRYTGGNTNTIAALDLLPTVFSVERGGRPGKTRTAITVTDGKPRTGNIPFPLRDIRAAVQRVTDQDIRLLVVGVTESIDNDTLKELSSSPHEVNKTVFVAKDYQSIQTVLEQLQIQTCINVTDKTPTTQSENLCTETLDLCFVVDGSGSICDSDEGFDYERDSTCQNWRDNVKFLHDLVNEFDIGLGAIRVGLVIFSKTAYVGWNLTAFTDKPSLLAAIDSLAYRKGGTTDMTGGLRVMRTQVFSLSNDRPDVRNLAVIITDGFPTVASTLQPEIDEVVRSGITVLAVGVTNRTDNSTIRRLASPPPKENENYFLNPDYSTLERNIGSLLSEKVCATSTLTTPPLNFGSASPNQSTAAGQVGDPCTEKLDLCFVVDGSGSICDSNEGFNYTTDVTCQNWKDNVKFIHDLVDDFTIGWGETRVGLVIFSSTSYVAINLTEFTDKSSLLAAIDGLTYSKGGTTDMTGGLRLMRTRVFDQTDDRPDIQNVAIIVTDGYPTDPSTLPDEISAVNASGIKTFVVGVTDRTDLYTIRRLALPQPKENVTYFLSPDYATLEENVKSQLSASVCDKSTPTTTPAIIVTAATPPRSTPGDQHTCTRMLDLCFVVDGSGSICDSDPDFHYATDTTCNNWKYNVDFISSVASSFDIGPLATRIALVVFSGSSSVEWNLTAYTNNQTLRAAISSLAYKKGGSTDMTGGLRVMRTQVFGQSDARQNVTRAAIIITDGYPTNASTLQAEIDAVNASGIRTISVGVTNLTDIATIKKLSSPPQLEGVTYFLNPEYSTLEQNLRSQLSEATCNAPSSTTPFIGVDIPVSPTPQPNDTSCEGVALDLAILLDGSGSICDSDPSFNFTTDSTCGNWNLTLAFIHNLISSIYNSPFTRIGLVEFSTTAQTVFALDTYTNLADILSAVDNLPYVKGGTTDMTGALHVARTEIFNTAGDRPGYPNRMVVITDGFPTQPSTLQAEINATQSSGVRILALGVTNNVDQSTLRRLSSPPHQINETYFMALNYVDIGSFSELLQAKICESSR